MEAVMRNNVVLLNADYSYLNTVNWKKALTLMSKGKVEILKYADSFIKNVKGTIIKIPAVMRLIKFIRTIYKTRVPFSKKNVMVRDGFTCVYCGDTHSRLTIDHVVPKAKGGKSTFENCVASCKPCNNRKGSKMPREAKMFPKTKLVSPTISEFFNMKMKKLGVDKVLDDLFNNI
jgi:5-methylcytosine-specific restriction endonuclease McrA